VDVHVGTALLGHVVDVIRVPIYGEGVLSIVKQKRVKIKAPRIITRKSMHKPMQTRLKAIDSLLLIGCDQHELIIGDKQIKKVVIAIDAILNQK
jgi:F0F1-type ATP synthase alpha subunit